MSGVVIFNCALLALIVFLLVALTRNNLTYAIRGAFVEMADFPASYRALPSYDEMVWHPKHWHRWTVRQWREYIEGRA